MPHVEGHAQRRRMGVVVPVCNGTNYRVQAGLMQLVNAALLATSLRSTGSRLELIALTRGPLWLTKRAENRGPWGISERR